MCWASDTLDTKRFKFRARRVLDALSSGQISKAGPCPPFEIKSINLQKWILAIIKTDLLHSQTKKTNTKTLYKHTTYKHMNRVREIHSTDINKDIYIYSHIKNTIPTRLTCTSSQGCPIHWHQWTKQRLNTQIEHKIFHMFPSDI